MGTPIPPPSGHRDAPPTASARWTPKPAAAPLHRFAHVIGGLGAASVIAALASEDWLRKGDWSRVHLALVALVVATALSYAVAWAHSGVGGALLVGLGGMAILEGPVRHGKTVVVLFMAPLVVSGAMFLIERWQRRG
jgi:hypothetical protein